MRGRTPAPKGMGDIFRLYLGITLLRRGPQDVPASTLLLALTIAAYLLVNAVASGVLPPDDHWWGPLLADAVFMAAWYAALLKLLGRPERTLQTLTAVFGFQAVLSPLLIASEWLMRRYGEGSGWQLPVTAIGLLLLAWLIAVNSHVVKAALEWSGAASVGLVILQMLASWVLVAAMFPPAKG